MKKILLGITGGIAAYKVPDLIRQLIDAEFEVKVVLSKNATAFVSLLTLESLLPNNVFEVLLEPSMQHIQLAKWADIILISPATANSIAKLAAGFSDDLLSCVCLASSAPIYLAPAMNQAMWNHAATQNNIKILVDRGVKILGPDVGLQACGDYGFGRMMEPVDIVNYLLTANQSSLLKNINILITAGSTRELIDPVRFISNKSSGKMGYAIANAAHDLGANVTVISGETHLPTPQCDHFIKVITAIDMKNAVEKNISDQTIFISVAAVSDFTVINYSAQKMKRNGEKIILELVPTADIVASVAARPDKPFVVAFAAETENGLENAKQKRLRKGADMIVLNDVSQSDIGFEQDDNAVTVISENNIIHLKKASKQHIAQQLLAIIAEQYSENANFYFAFAR